jgi:hypothetical protein
MEKFSHIHDTFQWDPNSGVPPIRIHPKTPSRRAKNATASRDQKRDVQMAARCGCNTKQIMDMLNLTQRQVLYAPTVCGPYKPNVQI